MRSRASHLLSVFFFNDTATTEIYTLSLHDALPISAATSPSHWPVEQSSSWLLRQGASATTSTSRSGGAGCGRSEEHTSELQSRRDLVCRLLLEKKKKKTSS